MIKKENIFFSKNVHSYRVCSFKLLNITFYIWETIINFNLMTLLSVFSKRLIDRTVELLDKFDDQPYYTIRNYM